MKLEHSMQPEKSNRLVHTGVCQQISNKVNGFINLIRREVVLEIIAEYGC